MSNEDAIFKLVKNHFHLDEKSLSFFKDRLYNFNVPPFYQEYFKDSKDFRKSFILSPENRMRFDPGWIMFQDAFCSFVSDRNVSYNDFKDNKITIEKNVLKIKKAIMDFYLNNKDQIPRDFSMPKSILKESGFIPYFDEAVSRKLEIIGTKKFPNSDLKLVVSNNFADWFMSSTSESWSSCLNMRSEFSGCYWSGIPGMIGDPNRTMVYFTDGQEKEFYEIKTEHFINRSFGLLDIEDKVFLLKFYPLKEMLSGNVIEEITGLPLTSTFNRTKYNINLMYHDAPINRTCFVYQDETNFYHESSKVFLVPGESAFYWMNKGSKLKNVKQFLYYKGAGLPFFIENNFTIAKALPKAQCRNCGHHILTDEDVFYHHDNPICGSCYSKMFIKCSCCGETIIKDESKRKDGNRYCNSCYIKKFRVICDVCGSNNDSNDIMIKDGVKHCIHCAINKFNSNNLKRCDRCNAVYIRYSDDRGCCESCNLTKSIKTSIETIKSKNDMFRIVMNRNPFEDNPYKVRLEEDPIEDNHYEHVQIQDRIEQEPVDDDFDPEDFV